MNTALTGLFTCEACLKIYAYGFRVRNSQQTAAAASCGNQSHYIEVAQGAIFMEQKIRFGLVLGRLAILKKKLEADYEQLLRVFFSGFLGQKNTLKFFFKYCGVRTKKLHQMKVRKPKINK